MKGDFTRDTFDPQKHYRSVRMQQGRVQVDADWNEQQDITDHRITTETTDVVGLCGGPWRHAGFHLVPLVTDLSADEQARPENQHPPPLTPGGDFYISGGRYYVDGILCENDRMVPYSQQPDLPLDAPVAAASGEVTIPPPDDGIYLGYLDVWSRHLTALEDPAIREVALGGPDTATRTKTTWQVKLRRVGDVGIDVNCLSTFAFWDDLTGPNARHLAARAEPGAEPDDPCIVAPGAGFRRLENQLYRVEIHDPGALGAATFKWSRDNGSILTTWEAKDGNDLTVASIGRDKVLHFANGDWVELTDDTHELLGVPGTLVRLDNAEAQVLTIDPATATGSVDLADFPANPKVRRWDFRDLTVPLVDVPAANDGWITLEDGVEIHFGGVGTFQTGDYWLIPARTTTADVEWPLDEFGDPALLLPHGIEHHYCRLGLLSFAGGVWTEIEDCRTLFPALTDLTDLLYVGGDGQEAMPHEPTLAHPLQVRVMNGQWPVEGARVRFSIEGMPDFPPGAGGQLEPAALSHPDGGIIVSTDQNGLAACTWTLDPAIVKQRVRAVLLDVAGDVIVGDDGEPIHVVSFNASLSIAREVAYDPANCDLLDAAVLTVQEAIDALCQRGGDAEPGFYVEDVRLISGGRLRNDYGVSLNDLAAGFRVVCTEAVDPQSISRATCFVTVEMPVIEEQVGAPTSRYAPVVLAAVTQGADNEIEWRMRNSTRLWLQGQIAALEERLGGVRILARFTLKGNFIWAADDRTLYLDGETLGRPRFGRTALALPSGDDKRGGDFEMWFWLCRPQLVANPVEVNFGAVAVGTVAERGITLTNIGNAPVRILTVGMEGAGFRAVFPQPTTAGLPFSFEIRPNGVFTGTVEFSPSEVDAFSGGLVFVTEGQCRPILEIDLRGEGRLQLPDLPGPGDIVVPGPGDIVVPGPGDIVAGGPGDIVARGPGDIVARRGTESVDSVSPVGVLDVRGIGPTLASRLEAAGITSAAEVAAMEPTRLAEVLNTGEGRASTIIDEARRLVAGDPGGS